LLTYHCRSVVPQETSRHSAVIDKAITGLARRMGCSIEKRWQAEGRTGAAMRYIGLVLKGKG
jgi:hypothetical protein